MTRSKLRAEETKQLFKHNDLILKITSDKEYYIQSFPPMLQNTIYVPSAPGTGIGIQVTEK